MKKILKKVLKNVNITQCLGEKINNKYVKGIFIHSKIVKLNTIFIAQKGLKKNSHCFIDESIKNGANTIISEIPPHLIHPNITYIIVPDSIEALGIISSNFYDNPTKKINLIGITGTNGKTSVATILHNIFSKIGKKSILISTIGIKIIYDYYPNKYTTPNIIDINKYLNLSIQKGCEYAFMEISSHGIHQKRIFGLIFKGGIFTNITHDHLDYHKSFHEYLSVKKSFLNQLILKKSSFILINIDDKNCSKILNKLNYDKIFYYGLINDQSNFKIKILKKSFNGSLLMIDHKKFFTKLIGTFNIYNILASYSASILIGLNKNNILEKIIEIKPIKGRFEQFISNQWGIRIIVDYAHNPMGLKNVLETIREIIKDSKLKINLICVIGCGGNRDKKKRSIMGKITYELCDISIFTSDNPRIENPNNILKDMKNFQSNERNKLIFSFINRKKAIQHAVQIANREDIILIAGKGHENFQEIHGKFYPFNDMKIAKNFLLKKNIKK